MNLGPVAGYALLYLTLGKLGSILGNASCAPCRLELCLSSRLPQGLTDCRRPGLVYGDVTAVLLQYLLSIVIRKVLKPSTVFADGVVTGFEPTTFRFQSGQSTNQ